MRLLTANIALVCLLSPAFGEPQQPNERQTVIVGPWNINTTYKGDKFDNCTMAPKTVPPLYHVPDTAPLSM